MHHPLAKSLNLLVAHDNAGKEAVFLSEALLATLSDKVFTDAADGSYFMDSPLLIHHIMGKTTLPVRVVSETECLKIYNQNIEELRKKNSASMVFDMEEGGIPKVFH